MNNATLRAYRASRKKYPTMGADRALAIARYEATTYDDWEEDSSGERVTTERDGFKIVLRAVLESNCPQPQGRRTNYSVEADYGTYVAAVGRDHSPHYYPTPALPPPMGLPAAHFKHPTATRDVWEFFYLDYIEDEYAAYRKSGMSKSVARDQLVAWIERTVSELMTDLAYYDVTVKVYRNDIELGASSMTYDTLTDGRSEEFIGFALEHGLVDEALDEAKQALANLVATTTKEDA
jgi:hypothetical protein